MNVQSRLAAFVLLSLAASQSPEPSARIVRLDAIVIDQHGRPILNLKASDFEVVESGVSQRIDAVEQGGTGGRVVALVLDEFHVSAGSSSERVRGAARRFVDELRPSDLLVVLKPLDSLTDIHFTTDRDAARAAIAGFEGRKGNYSALTEFEEKYIGRAPEAVQGARGQIVFSALRALTLKVGEMEPGRSAVVLLSGGFSLDPRRERERRVGDAQGLVRAASRHNVAIYVFHPDGELSNGHEPDDTWLRTLAVETGGEAVMTGADMDAAFRRVSRDLDSYYLLSYTSSHEDDGRFYDVQVRARSRDAKVRARTGYWAPLRAEFARAADSRPPPARALRRSPLIATWTGLSIAPDGTPQITFTWEPAATKGARRTAVPSVVSLKVTTKTGAVLFEGELSAPRSVPGLVREQVAVFDAQPGRIQLDLSIKGTDGTQIDSAAQDIDVPDANRSDPVILPPQVFRTASAREFRDISVNPLAAPVPSREFHRTERLLVRVPTYSASGTNVNLNARLMNRAGQILRELVPMDRNTGSSVRQFDLPLAWLAPGEYSIELNANSSKGKAREVVRFKITG
jgi:VWFA-related protein